MITQVFECYLCLPQHKDLAGAIRQAVEHYENKYGHSPLILYHPPEMDIDSTGYLCDALELMVKPWKRAKKPYFYLGMERDKGGEL